MLKNILELGKPLSKKQQKEVNGGVIVFDCSGLPDGTLCWHLECPSNVATCLNGFCGY